jgi:hypothetical protein
MVVTLGPKTVATVATASVLASGLLAALTVLWFAHVKPRHYSEVGPPKLLGSAVVAAPV